MWCLNVFVRVVYKLLSGVQWFVFVLCCCVCVFGCVCVLVMITFDGAWCVVVCRVVVFVGGLLECACVLFVMRCVTLSVVVVVLVWLCCDCV